MPPISWLVNRVCVPSDAQSVIFLTLYAPSTAPRGLFLQPLNGAEVLGVYQVRPSLRRLDKGAAPSEGDREIAVRLRLPPLGAGERGVLLIRAGEFEGVVTVTFTRDPRAFRRENSPYPRLLFQLAEAAHRLATRPSMESARRAMLILNSALRGEEESREVSLSPSLQDLCGEIRERLEGMGIGLDTVY